MFPLAVMWPLNVWESVDSSPNIVLPSVVTVEDVTYDAVKCVTSSAFVVIVPLELKFWT